MQNQCQTTAVIKTLTFNHQYSWVRRSVPHDLTNLLRLNRAQIQVCMIFHKCYYFCLDLRDLGTKLEKELLNNVSAVAR